ncbi:MAG: NAD+ synthase [Thermodesulfobacteriota bacterium]
MKLALAQINPLVGDFAGNALKIAGYAERARSAACHLVVFPELCICGYPPRDLLEREDFLRECGKTVTRIMESVSGIGILLGVPEATNHGPGKPISNAALLLEDGKVVATARKSLLPSYDVFDETRYFEPDKKASAFWYKKTRLGITICEDAWNDPELFSNRLYERDPVAEQVADGAELLINIAASPFYHGKLKFRRRLMAHLARKYKVGAVYVNQVGGNDSLLFDGASTAHDRTGALRAAASDFAEDLVFFDTESGAGDIHPVCEEDIPAVYEALVMGTSDYASKCGFKSAVVGLSGGVDSALVAAVAARALSPEKVTALFMPSPYTSRDNYEDTEALCRNLGIRREVIPITGIFDSFLAGLSGHAEKGGVSVTEQNIQARIRGVLLMAFSNRHGALLLSTGNKSELAVGYSTLYGDMCGGLAVISDVPKTLVYDVCRYINKEGAIIPERILSKAPSAELRPDQRDDDDLPPYHVLDPILEAYVEKGWEKERIAAAGYDPAVVRDVIRRVTRNEYKRRQAAPGLKITPKAFGEGRRYPIAQAWNG